MLAVKKNVFSAILKLSKDGELRTEHGNRFHATGPATTNARSANFVLVRWTTRSPRADDRVRPSMQELAQSSDKYAGASWRWYSVAAGEMWTRDVAIASTARYHTATRAELRKNL